MSGAFHVRMVTGILVVAALWIVAPYAFVWLMGVQVDPLNVVAGAAFLIIVAVLYPRGSKAASYAVNALSVISILGWILELPTVAADSIYVKGTAAVFTIAAGYCLWATAGSKAVSAELERRRDANKFRELDEAGKFARRSSEKAE